MHSILKYHNIAINREFCQYFIDLRYYYTSIISKLHEVTLVLVRPKFTGFLMISFKECINFDMGVGGGNS